LTKFGALQSSSVLFRELRGNACVLRAIHGVTSALSISRSDKVNISAAGAEELTYHKAWRKQDHVDDIAQEVFNVA